MRVVPNIDSRASKDQSNHSGASLEHRGGDVEVVGSTWRLHLDGNSTDWVSPPALLHDFIAELFAYAPQDILGWVHSAAWRLREESWQGMLTREPSWDKQSWRPHDSWERGVPSEKSATATSLKVQSLAVRTAQGPPPREWIRSCLRSPSPCALGGRDELVGKPSWELRDSGHDVRETAGHSAGNGILEVGSGSTLSLHSSAVRSPHSGKIGPLAAGSGSSVSLHSSAVCGNIGSLRSARSYDMFSPRESGKAGKKASIAHVSQLEYYEVPSAERDTSSTQIAAFSHDPLLQPHKVTTITNDTDIATTEPREFLRQFTMGGKKQQSSVRSSASSFSTPEKSWSCLPPTTWKSFVWTGLFVVCLLLELWVLPLEIVFFKHELPSWTGAADIFFLSFFTLDIGMNSVTGYISKGVLHTEWPSSCFRYMRRWMWLDLGTTLPYIACIASGGEKISLRWLMVARILRLPRVRKWMSLFPLFVPYLRPIMPLLRLQIVLLLIVHIFAVIYALLQPSQWVDKYPDGPYGCYLQCLRWSFVAITVGSTPDNADRFRQTIWDLLVSISRVFVLLVILDWTKTHSLVRFTRRTRRSQMSQSQIDEEGLCAYLSRRGIHPSLQIQVMDALGEIEDAQKDQSGRAWIFSQIIDSDLRQWLKQCMWESSIKTLGMFFTLNLWHRSFVVELAAFVEEVVLPPGAVLISAGDPTVTAYFILEGTIGVVIYPGMNPVVDYTKRMWVGEQALLNLELPAKETLYCRSRTELMAVHAKHFRSLLEEHNLVQMYQQFLQETLWMGFCGRCGLFGDHFSNDCPTLEGSSWKAVISSLPQVGSKKRKSRKYKNELLKILSDHGLAHMAAEMHRYAIKNVNDLNTAAFDDFLDDEDNRILRQDKEKLRKMVDKFKKRAVQETTALMNTTTADDHLIFISHYKAEAGTEATLMQRDLEGLILRDRISPNLVSPVFVDSENLTNLADLQASVLRSYNVVILLTPGVLTRPWVLVEISLAFRHEINVIPVEVQRPNLKFDYPDEAYLKGIGTGEQLDAECTDLLNQEGVLLSDLEAALRQLFKLIAMPFSPHKSNSIRAAELEDVIKRCIQRPPHATSASPNSAERARPIAFKPVPKNQSAMPISMTYARSMRPTKTARNENAMDSGHALSLAASQAMGRVKQRLSVLNEFKVGDRVIVIKDSRTKGRLATVIDPDWHGIVKVDMDIEDAKGKTKTYQPGELERIPEPKEDKVLEDKRVSFKIGDRVRIIKESGTKGKTAVVVEPHWHDLVKVTMDIPDDKGATKSFKPADLELV